MKITIEMYDKSVTFEQAQTATGIETTNISDIAEAVTGMLIAVGFHPNTVAQHIKIEADA